VALVDGRSRGLHCCCSCGFPRGGPTPVTMVERFRFSSLPPSIPCMRFSRTRLTDIVHRLACTGR
jgi:hypothetical protein